ncbi:MAG TPA: hypothetical protein VF729_10340, partial [Solirubrobacterales bacterium]
MEKSKGADMNTNLRLSVVGVLVLIAAAFSAAITNAETGGHYTSDTSHTIVKGVEEGTERTEFSFTGVEGKISCDDASYEGTLSATTTTSVTLTPKLAKCRTTGQENTWNIDTNGCAYVLTIGKKASGANTMDIECPAGKSIEITHPNCTIKIAPQTGIQITLDIIFLPRLHLKLTIKFTIKASYESGVCVFLGTSQTGELGGSVLLKGFDTAGEQVDL